MKKLFIKLLSLLLSLFALSSCSFIKNKNLHGEDLAKLSNDELYEAVYFQNLDIVTSFESEKLALAQMSSFRRTVFILSMYEYEIGNGGLCQFFVNSSRELAPYVSECLEEVGATEHKELFDNFISDNSIDINSLDYFEIDNLDEYAEKAELYDFDAFDDAYMELPYLTDTIVEYIRENINEF